MLPVKTSSFQLPNSQQVDVVFVKLDDGRIVPRHPTEVVKRPTPPAVSQK
jgi:hypothetical protein